MTSSVPVAGRLIAAVAIILAAAQVAACGSARSPAAPASPSVSPADGPSPPNGSAAATPQPARSTPAATECASATLRPTLVPMGAAAGTAYYALRLTNMSGSTCTLYGYPGVSFTSAVNGQQIGSAATRNPQYPATRVAVAANATAHATLGIAAAGNYPASRCHPVTAHALRIFPPGETAAVYVKESFPACSAHVTVLTVTVMRVGLGGQGM